MSHATLFSNNIGSNDMSSQVEELIKELPGHLVVMKEQLRLLDVIGQGESNAIPIL